MIRTEYLRFLKTLTSGAAPPNVCKVANLALAHLDDLVPLSTVKAQRIKKVVELAQANWASISAEIQPATEQAGKQTCPITQLKSLSVGPFRGFARQEDFDLNSRLVLIYGQNGTGKSSFCEAVEYGLLGNVTEGDSKRFRDQREYLKNARTGTFKAPTLVGVDSKGQDVPVFADESLYRFCFVEKNRIDSFSRIAAQAPAKQAELISTLFGLDAFTEFVRNFTPEIDGKYIDLQGVKAKQLHDKRQELAGFQQQLVTVPEELQKLDDEERELAKTYREDCTFAGMNTELNGDAANPGLIQRLDTELQQPLAIKSNVTASALQVLKESVISNVADLNAKQQELSVASKQISFKQLYEAVTQVQTNSPEQCPACQTPLTQVAVNPYTHAGEELGKLQHLSELQQDAKTLEEQIGKLLTDLSQIIKTCCARFQEDNKLATIQVSSEEAAGIDWWNSLHQQSEGELSLWHHVVTQVAQLEKVDKAIDQAVQQRAEKQAELKRLRQFAEKIVILQTRRKTANDSIVKAKEAIEKFDTENATLITDVEAEKSVVTQNQAIASAYATFVQKLNSYRDGLPAQLVADLGDIVVTLYNAFNHYDGQHEQLAAVRLPLSQNQRLEIAFQDDPSTFFDALHVLSEGHIRCIGLAILAAKNIKENCPLLIFDDPVNAIDDEHRRAIRKTLFADDFFRNQQIILAIHGEEFFNSTHQFIGKQAAKEAESYIFSAKENGQYHIQVNALKRPKNYILAARELYKTGEYRDSLMSARRGLENLCEKAWYHYGRYSDKSDKPISVARRSPDQPWDLKYLADNLKSRFNSSKADIPNREQIVSSLAIVLGTDAKQPPWTYFNTGTHAGTDLPEFDQSIVNEIVAALEKFDSSLGYS
jgi:energy-coupling factor transporter ATP-binding protein EcfA2